MYGSRIMALALAAFSGSLEYSLHYNQQLVARSTPSQSEIRFLLWYDEPQVIGDYPDDPRGSCCLIWGTTDDTGRVAHLLCANPPKSLVITAYFPSETRPDEWEDNYRRRNTGEEE